LETLPYSWYAEPEMLRREQELIFARSWQYAGHMGQLPEPGSFFTYTAGLTPIVVTRARDEELRAFVNVCRHRGFTVAQGEGRRETLQCPYHAWTYGLDGSLRAAPRSELEPGFDRTELGLMPAGVGTWGPFVFVNPDAEGAPLEEALGRMPQQVAELGLDVDALEFRLRSEFELEANWKICCENFLECYHCQLVHPDLSEAIDVSADGYGLETEGLVSTQHAPVRSEVTEHYDGRGEITAGQFHYLWPGTVVNILHGRPNISIGPVNPITHTRTSRFLDYFFRPGEDQEWIDQLVEFDEQVGREDRGLVEGVQRGVTSGVISSGRLLERSERLIAHFQALTAAALG
ncbi:MAG TPA: aromatic ring-hydroxylating dioxygenase subunit alpha, partial [Gaiellaceae bacterium]